MHRLMFLMLAACGRIGFDLGDLSVDEARGRLAVGAAHSCAVRGDEVWCWGDGRVGQTGAGVGSLGVHPIPVRVANLPPAISVAAGNVHACAITTDGEVYCWGASGNGQAGPVTEKPLRAPFEDPTADPVPGLPEPAIEISAGSEHTCALLADRTVWCWGRDNFGQLGRGQINDQDLGFPTPQQVDGLSGIVQLSVSEDSSCALSADGTISCWGENSQAQLGDRSTTTRTRPVAMEGIVATAVSIGGDHTCALVDGGRLACWGANFHGELGVDNGTILQSNTPRFSTADGYLAISAGITHTCAITADRSVECWGDGGAGQLGHGSFEKTFVPQEVPITSVSAIASGATNTCALRTTGEVKCWGRGDFGQLGDGTVLDRSPTRVAGVASTSMVTGFDHTCAVEGETIKCWGYNSSGQLGDGTVGESATPRLVSQTWGTGLAIAGLATGANHTCTIVEPGDVWCWGANDVGQLGDGTNNGRVEAVRVVGLPASILQIASSSNSTCALAANDEIWCWGQNDHGQLADGTTTDRNVPARVGTGFDIVVAGRTHFCAHTIAVGVTCWGGNEFGQVGNGATQTDVLSPVQLPVDGTLMWAGAFSTCIRNAGATTCWGYNARNQLLTNVANGVEPLPVASSLPGPTSASDDTICRISGTPTVECWGDNSFGQLGNGTFDGSEDPQAVLLPSDPREVVVGDQHACVRMTDNSVYCWGENIFGQTGSGRLGRRAVPGVVAFP